MSPDTTSSSNQSNSIQFDKGFSIDKFNGTNYVLWSKKLQILFKYYGLNDTLENSITSAEKEERAFTYI